MYKYGCGHVTEEDDTTKIVVVERPCVLCVKAQAVFEIFKVSLPPGTDHMEFLRAMVEVSYSDGEIG